MTSPYTSEEIIKQMKGILEFDFRTSPKEATNKQIYKAISKIVVHHLKEKRHKFMTKNNSQGKKQVYYISMEFLMGRSLKTNLYNLGMTEEVEKAVKETFNVKLDSIYEEEPDAGLGNGGLGRLAACYMDGLATCALPATGYSILYEYGIFKQKIMEGWQTELPDDWLPGGEVWLAPVPDQAIQVHFDGYIQESWSDDYHSVNHVNYTTVNAVPYDMYVSGYDSEGVSKLRLWKAEGMSFDMSAFNKGNYDAALGASNIAHSLTKVLYPNDNHLEGKALRLRQQYFMCAASIGDIVMRHMNIYGTLDNLHEKVAIHINDTHPTLAIPELMRIMLDECGYSWSKAWHIVSNTFAYTNHTVMAEALEKWDENMLRNILPRIYTIICEINRRYCEGLRNRLGDEGKIARMSIVSNNQIKMANLCTDACHSVNGVSKLHSEIIKESVFKEEYSDKPFKFKNVTNGIAYRRWLLQSNKGLTDLLSECIGDGFKKNAAELNHFSMFKDDDSVLRKLAQIKRDNKVTFCSYVEKSTGRKLNPDSIFDVQVKRLHEYKRQQLNVLNILSDYNYLLENPNADFVPKTYIFASKAAPGYYMAKQIIKLMLNGAVTMGTYDGANVEICEQVGRDNIFIFGMSADEVNAAKGGGYRPESICNSDERISAAINRMYGGINGAKFDEVANSLKFTDQYMAFADFDSYRKAQLAASEKYKDVLGWNKMSLMNIAGAGVFSADRAVMDYARDIWNLV